MAISAEADVVAMQGLPHLRLAMTQKTEAALLVALGEAKAPPLHV
ncbi:MAG: hypothetical protein NTW48_06415 [Chloroflexi bacterium]|nr:hypothetical protein [Chloroflexota bacterium]